MLLPYKDPNNVVNGNNVETEVGFGDGMNGDMFPGPNMRFEDTVIHMAAVDKTLNAVGPDAVVQATTGKERIDRFGGEVGIEDWGGVLGSEVRGLGDRIPDDQYGK
jgi:hypothetical protein